MELNEAQYQQIERCLPRQRGNVSHTNLLVINAIFTWPSMVASGAVCPNVSAIGTRSARA